MKTQIALALVSVLSLAACGTAPASSSKVADDNAAGPGLQLVTVTGDAGDQFMSALDASGVSDLTQAIGAVNYAVDQINCGLPVVPHPQAHCSISWSGNQLTVAPADATTLDEILAANGAVLTHTGLMGSANAQATAISCHRIVYPDAHATCTFYVAPQN